MDIALHHSQNKAKDNILVIKTSAFNIYTLNNFDYFCMSFWDKGEELLLCWEQNGILFFTKITTRVFHCIWAVTPQCFSSGICLSQEQIKQKDLFELIFPHLLFIQVPLTHNERDLSVPHELLSTQHESNFEICSQSLPLEYNLIFQRQTIEWMLKMWKNYYSLYSESLYHLITCCIACI